MSFRWGKGTAMKHGGFFSGPDRFDPGKLQRHKWEDALTVDKVSWGIRRNINIEDIMSMDELIEKVRSTKSNFSLSVVQCCQVFHT